MFKNVLEGIEGSRRLSQIEKKEIFSRRKNE
jgi:hypothetical protein